MSAPAGHRSTGQSGAGHSGPVALALARDLTTAPLRAAIDQLSPAVRQVSAYHFGWIDADGKPVDGNGGKAVRPALALLSARAGGAAPDVGIPGALAVELVHNFSLLHDDVMDGDRERRHRPTAWTVFGESAAILAGDALLTLAFQLLDTAGEPAHRAQQRLGRATQRLIDGQVDDLDFESRDDVTLEQCVEMAAGKTAALMACASSIGAELADAPGPLVDALDRFGYHLGLAFQLVDDILGIWGTTEATGKPVGADLLAHKKSLPVVAAITADAPAARRLRAVFADGGPHDADGVAEAAALVEEAGGRDWTVAEAARRLDLACSALDVQGIDATARTELEAVAHFVTDRDR